MGMEQLKKHRDDLRVERDHLKAQTVEQQDMIFDVQNQVRYLNTELERNRTTIIEMKKDKKKRESQLQMSTDFSNIIGIADGMEDYTDSEEELEMDRSVSTNSSSKGRSKGNQASNGYKNKMNLQKPKKRKSKIQKK